MNADRAAIYRNLMRYVDTHHPGTRWSVLTVAAPTAAPMILLGSPAGALAGYSGTDPALDGPGLAHLVAKGEARYVVLGGAYASRGGNLATEGGAARVPPGALIKPGTVPTPPLMSWCCSTAPVASARSKPKLTSRRSRSVSSPQLARVPIQAARRAATIRRRALAA